MIKPSWNAVGRLWSFLDWELRRTELRNQRHEPLDQKWSDGTTVGSDQHKGRGDNLDVIVGTVVDLIIRTGMFVTEASPRGDFHSMSFRLSHYFPARAGALRKSLFLSLTNCAIVLPTTLEEMGAVWLDHSDARLQYQPLRDIERPFSLFVGTN